VFGERHLRHLLGSYQRYYNDARTHLSLNKMPRRGVLFRPLAASCPTCISEVCTINMSGSDFR
jgi:hypothetical protein